MKSHLVKSSLSKLLILSCSLTTLLLISVTQVEAITCTQIFKTSDYNKNRVQLPADSELSIYRFFSQESTKNAYVASYDLKDGLFQPKQIGVLSVDSKLSNQSTTILERLQNFSTHVMMKNGYITKETKDRQPSLLPYIGTNQVSFIEITRPVKNSILEAQPEKYPTDIISDRFDEKLEGVTHVRDSGLWIISGQFMYPHNREDFHNNSNNQHLGRANDIWSVPGNLISTDTNYSPLNIYFGKQALPWQRNKAIVKKSRLPINIKDRFAELDPKKFPITFELGRIAQLVPGRFKEMLKAATALMVEEVEVMLQGDISEAYVFVNVMSPYRAFRFKKMGFKILKEACISSKVCILYIPLKDLTKDYAPASNSYRVNKILEYFPKWDESSALNFLRRVQTYFRSDLDFVFPEFSLHQQEPIVVQDFSSNYKLLLKTFALRFGIKSQEKADELINIVDQWKNEGNQDQNSQLADEIPLFQQLNDYLYKNNMIRITNISESLVETEGAVPVLLIALNQFILRRHQEISLVEDADAFLDTYKELFFLIQTTSQKVANSIRQYSHQELAPIESKGKIIYSFPITRTEIKEFEQQQPGVTDLLRTKGLDQGFWFFRSLSATPLKF